MSAKLNPYRSTWMGTIRATIPLGIALLLLIGVGFRGWNLEDKVYWHDEVYTTLRVVGYDGSQVETRMFNNHLHRAEDLLQFQTYSPDRDWGDTLQAFLSHPEHPPLYYGLTWGWTQLWGSSILSFRSLSALISLLSLPAIAWLSHNLFASRVMPWIAMGLLAVSPVHILYAQEAREYSLWVLTILLSSTLLLRSLRIGGWRNWLLYSLALTTGFYTTLLMSLVAIAQALFVLLSQPRQQWTRFAIAGSGALLLFSPWLLVMIQAMAKFQTVTHWTTVQRDVGFLFKIWGLHLSSTWIDLGLDINHPYTYILPPVTGVLLLGGLIWTRRTQPRTAWIFLLCLILVPVLPLMLPDLIQGGQRSVLTRYFFAALIGVELTLAYLISALIESPQRSRAYLGLGLFTTLLVGSITSCSLSAQAHTWWNKGVSYDNANSAELINQQAQPLILTDLTPNALGNVLSLSHRLRPEIPFLLVDLPTLPPLPTGFHPVYLFKPSGEMIAASEQQYQATARHIEAPPGIYELWELTLPQ